MSFSGFPTDAVLRVSSPALEEVKYRADIDGLRAIAVLAVVASHAEIPRFTGGFLGVDIFFVISGFLITRNLEASTHSGFRRFIAFYGRRMRRTLPALYFVATVTFVAGLVLLLPGELDDLAHSLIGVLLLVPNVVFLTQAGYFDHAAMTKPLLHTWSLGVEEQFYLFAPLLPFGLRRFRPGGRKVVLYGLFALALAFCVFLRASAPSAAFYLMPARLWEFLAGCIVAERVVPPLRARWQAEILAAAALLALGFAIATFSIDTAHPGLPTLVPCLATTVLIFVGSAHQTLAGRLLGQNTMAGIGLISYSIYLWHWPMLVFARLGGHAPSMLQVMAGALLLFSLSYLSWRYVEVPFRKAGSRLREHAPVILPAAALSLGALSVTTIVAHGWPGRFGPDVARVAGFYDYAKHREFREGSCFITTKYSDAAWFDREECLRTATNKPNYLIIGDSQAAHLWIGFKRVFIKANIMQATASGCRPFLQTSGKRYCTDLMTQVMRRDLPKHPVDIIFLSAAWQSGDLGSLAETVDYLKHYARKVLLIGPIPSYDEALPSLLARSLVDREPGLPDEHRAPFVSELDKALKRAFPPDEYISLVDGLCPAGKCRVYAKTGVPLQFDESHLTSEGSELVARLIEGSGLLVSRPR